ncbi:DUF2779 domain-containing protein [Spiribacter pallidus]|uniref:DUF2779 domain-containing protein n=1 Tax=Spiribacter pallidus TaxID=1987936 RepID=A0ABV3T932_9GAMM
MPKYLTKARFALGLQCPRKLFYAVRPGVYVDQRRDNTMLEGLAEGGHQIGAMAQNLFMQADGDLAREITDRDLDEQIDRTTRALAQDSVTLFEPTIAYGDYLVRVDILRKQGNRIELVEVKSKSFDSRSDEPRDNPTSWTRAGGIHAGFLSYVRDLAFQYWVVRQAYPEWEIHCYLMMPDKAVPAREDVLHQRFPVYFDELGGGSGHFRARVDPVAGLAAEQLDESFLSRILMDRQVDHVLDALLEIPGITDDFSGVAERLARIQAAETPITPAPVGSHCSDCEFYAPVPSATGKSGFHECWAEWSGQSHGFDRGDTIFGLYGRAAAGVTSSQGLLEAGYQWLTDIDPDEISLPDRLTGALGRGDRQRMQLTGDWPGGGDHYFDSVGFASALESCDWPLYFLDFEAARSALPFRAGRRPQDIQIFQYSVHVMERDGSVRHADEFLDLSVDGDVNSRMLRHLKEALGSIGTVLRWTSYENTVLNNVRAQLLEMDAPPDDRDELVAFIESLTHERNGNEIARRGERDMVDQARWAADFYFHPQTRGSSSIKPLLPAVMKNSEQLRALYSEPVYGTGRMPSRNFSNKRWWVGVPDSDETPEDPYKLLESTFSHELLGGSPEVRYYQRFESISNGAGAMMAYTRAQSGTMNTSIRGAIEASLKQYCELDTLAMVMIMQAWRAEAGI